MQFVHPQPPGDRLNPTSSRFEAIADLYRRISDSVSLGSVIPLLVTVVGLFVVGGWIAFSPASRDQQGSSPVEVRLPKDAAAGMSSASNDASELVVQAAGAVNRPGVYRLPPSARAIDLLEAAGGASGSADLSQVNLAAPLADGERVYFPKSGEPVPEPASPAVLNGGNAITNLNSATAEQLEALPGIGPTTASAILEYRKRHGRFRSVNELLDVRGIGDAKLAELRAKVRV